MKASIPYTAALGKQAEVVLEKKTKIVSLFSFSPCPNTRGNNLEKFSFLMMPLNAFSRFSVMNSSK